MDFLAATFNSLLSIVFFCLFVAGVLKVFQIATTLTEIKDLLSKAQRTEFLPQVSPSAEPWAASVNSQTMATQNLVRQGLPPQPGVNKIPEIPLSGEAMLRALDLEMRLEDENRKPSIVETSATATSGDRETSAPARD